MRDGAKGSCANNLDQIGLALQSYHASHNSFPYEIAEYNRPPSPLLGIKESYSALARILPYLEQQALYSGLNFDVEMYPSPFDASPQQPHGFRHKPFLLSLPLRRRGVVGRTQ